MAEPSPPYNPQGASAPYNPQAAASPTMPQEETNPSKVDVASGCALPRNPVTNNCVGAPGFEGNRHMERSVFVHIAQQHARTHARTHAHARTRALVIERIKYSINDVWQMFDM